MQWKVCRHVEVKDQPSLFMLFIVRFCMFHHTSSSYWGTVIYLTWKKLSFFLFSQLKITFKMFVCPLASQKAFMLNVILLHFDWWVLVLPRCLYGG